MDVSRELKEVFEVDVNGTIIDSYLWDENQINDATKEGRHIIQTKWEGSLHNPIWDFGNQEWVHGLSEEEIRQREQEAEEQQSKLSDAYMQALAILELALDIEKLKGGS